VAAQRVRRVVRSQSAEVEDILEQAPLGLAARLVWVDQRRPGRRRPVRDQPRRERLGGCPQGWTRDAAAATRVERQPLRRDIAHQPGVLLAVESKQRRVAADEGAEPGPICCGGDTDQPLGRVAHLRVLDQGIGVVHVDPDTDREAVAGKRHRQLAMRRLAPDH
jgi:hypothetical protein